MQQQGIDPVFRQMASAAALWNEFLVYCSLSMWVGTLFAVVSSLWLALRTVTIGLAGLALLWLPHPAAITWLVLMVSSLFFWHCLAHSHHHHQSIMTPCLSRIASHRSFLRRWPPWQCHWTGLLQAGRKPWCAFPCATPPAITASNCMWRTQPP